MGSNKKLYGNYPTTSEFLPVKVNSNGKIVLSNIPAHASSHNVSGSDVVDYIPLNGWIVNPYSILFSQWDVTSCTAQILIQEGTDVLYSLGYRIKLTQPTGGVKYGIITAKSTSAIWVYFGTDYILNDEVIYYPYYSPVKAPLGFPLDPIKWTVKIIDSTNRVCPRYPVVGTWYNIGTTNSQIKLPKGCWNVSFKVTGCCDRPSSGALHIMITLSTANNSESDTESTVSSYISSDVHVRFPTFLLKQLSVANTTIYYLNAKTLVAGLDYLYYLNTEGTMVISAVCAYL